MSDPRTLIEKYTVLGTIAGGTGNLAITGSVYGYFKLRAAARR